jgi:hypothetical protein
MEWAPRHHRRHERGDRSVVIPSESSLEQLGLPRDAARHYAEFVRLREDADSELPPIVDDVRQRLVRLDR